MLHSFPVVGDDLAALLDYREFAFMACELDGQRALLDLPRKHERFAGSRDGQCYVRILQSLINGPRNTDWCAPSLTAILNNRLRTRALSAIEGNLLKTRQLRVQRKDLGSRLHT